MKSCIRLLRLLIWKLQRKNLLLLTLREMRHRPRSWQQLIRMMMQRRNRPSRSRKLAAAPMRAPMTPSNRSNEQHGNRYQKADQSPSSNQRAEQQGSGHEE